MATVLAPEKKTIVQKLSDLVEWYLLDKGVELKFIPSTDRKGRLAPEFTFEYWMDGRRCTERCLAMLITTELAGMNYNFSIGRVIPALTALAWRNYVATQDYPDWIKKSNTEPVVRKPVGRPRLHPRKLKYDEFIDDDQVEMNLRDEVS